MANKKLILIIFAVIVILAVFASGPEALAGYHSSGTLISINLLSGLTVTSIDSFYYNASSIPTGTSLKVQFSQDNTNWYNSAGTLNGWDDCTTGGATISLSALGWSGPNFYYKMQFTSDGSATPVLDEISVTYTSPPTVLTEKATVDIQNNEATLKGSITDTGGAVVDKIMFVWGTSPGSYPNDSGEIAYIGTFEYTLGLTPGTIYYYKAKAHNSAGWSDLDATNERRVVIYTALGSLQEFTTLSITHTLTVDKSGTGSGTVTSTPAGINCGTDCSEAYASGTSVTLTATADSGSEFIGWSGDCSGIGSCTLTMDSDKNVTSTFNLLTYTLTGSITGTGSGTVNVNPPNIDYTIDFSETYDSGTSVTLTATPDSGSTFAGWSGDCSGIGSCTLTMDTDKSVTATFTLITYTLTVSKDGTGSGTVTNTGINCGTDCSEDYNPGTSVTLTATPDSGSTFAGWSGDCSGTGSCTLTMDSDKIATAIFTLITYTLTVSKDGTGSGTVTNSGINCGTDCSESYISGTSVTLTATPDSGSTFAGWSGDCSGTGSCTLTMDSDKNVTSTFNLLTYTLTGSITGTGSGTVNVNPPNIDYTIDFTEDYDSGTSVTLTATADSGSTFAGWSGDCSGIGTCTLTMDADKSVTATFDADITEPTVEIRIFDSGNNGIPGDDDDNDVTDIKQWLKADSYTIKFKAIDNESGLDNYEYYIYTCETIAEELVCDYDNPIDHLTGNYQGEIGTEVTVDHLFEAGLSPAKYNLEGAGRYLIDFTATDIAGRAGNIQRGLNTDFTPPTPIIE